MPYIILLLLFAGFVVWNGSVVLGKRFNTFNRYGNLTAVGDKSAHTATIHLPQMLYVWPYIAFFSAPLLVGPLLGPVLPILPKRLQAAICENYVDASKYGLPTIITSGLFITLGLIAVYFNTIIHPYTLADNRHYVFYVFRIFRLYPATKYLAVPVYFVCAWLSIQSLASPSLVGQGVSKTKREDQPTNDKADRQPCQVSFITIWLATTALSTVTAPLVEPRYFIIPWLIWRLHVPRSLASLSCNRYMDKATYDMRLVLETFWLLAINAAVSYTFLYRTFIWPSEPGNLQRFIW
jgi:alpha-1,2-glucosyltransferase